jgi:hypothetical protein
MASTSAKSKAEGIQKLHLVGVSIGAVLIQDFANRYDAESILIFGSTAS